MKKPTLTLEGGLKFLGTIATVVVATFYVEDRLATAAREAIKQELVTLTIRVADLEKVVDKQDISRSTLLAFMNRQIYRNKVGEGRTHDIESFLGKRFPIEYLKPSEIKFEEDK